MVMFQCGLAIVNGDKRCSKWSDSELRDMYTEYIADTQDYAGEFVAMNLERRNKKSFAHIHKNDESLESRLFGITKCYSTINRSSGDSMERTLCPWYILLTYDEDRYPKELATAKCTCRYCYDFNGKKDRTSNKKRKPRCKDIKIKHKVLTYEKSSDGKPVCDPDNKKFRIQKAVEEITVGCACAIRRKDKTGRGYVLKTGDGD
ncbi:Interleukin 17F [Mactra antiquata]